VFTHFDLICFIFVYFVLLQVLLGIRLAGRLLRVWKLVEMAAKIHRCASITQKLGMSHSKINPLTLSFSILKSTTILH
jgi:hypothetical protein